MYKLLKKYKELLKNEKWNKITLKTLTRGETISLIVAGMIFLFLDILIFVFSDYLDIQKMILACFALLFLAVYMVYILERIKSDTFRKEKLRGENWQIDFDKMLKECGFQSEDIPLLKERCDQILNEQTAVKKFGAGCEKIMNVFIIQIILSVAMSVISQNEGKYQIYWFCLVVFGLLEIGIVIYLLVPLIVNSNADEEDIRNLRWDLSEMMIYYTKSKR